MSNISSDVPLEQRFEACMVLGGVGDALGYKSGEWEFARSGKIIHDALAALGGLGAVHVNSHAWMLSDDTIMHIATAEALISDYSSPDQLYSKLAERYQECLKDMAGRAPGQTCMKWIPKLKPKVANGYVIGFNERGGGCGCAMRAAPIGLAFSRPDQMEELIAVAIESGRMSHNHPTGYLGGLAVALFVSYAIQQKPLREWGTGLMDTLELAWKYVEKSGRDVELNRKHWSYFEDAWKKYLALRGLETGTSDPIFPDPYGISERDAFYKSVSFGGWGGSSGHDAPMIAYDALLGAGDSWSELCSRAMFHGGDSDSTAIIAAACRGAMRGYGGVPNGHYRDLEYRSRLIDLAQKLRAKYTS